MSVLVIDYGSGNLASVRRAVEECGGSAYISNQPEEIKNASHIILPGMGSFADAMNNLRDGGWVGALHKAAIADQIPLLGICLGMHVLADRGYESGESEGLGLIGGDVIRLTSTSIDERIPHVGWNEISIQNNGGLFDKVPDRTDFYFVHSYHFVPSTADSILTTTPYCNSFVSAIKKKNILGVQFHPEKSSSPGFQVLRNFLSMGTM